MKIIYLDIDGVLNGHIFNEKARSNSIDRQCMENLNYIIDKTKAQCIISSAWRYMILGGAMTLLGFSYMLRTHGFEGELLDITPSDEILFNRDEQIRTSYQLHWPTKYVVLDDLDIIQSHPFVQTNGKVGLTRSDAEKAITLLNKE